MIILWVVLGVLVLATVGGSFYFATLILWPKHFTTEKTRELEIENGKMKAVEFDAWVKEDVHILSPFGYGLFGQFFPLPNAKGTILILHGHTYTLYGSVKYMGMFRERGFNVLLMDNRFHGRSGGPNCTFGFREREDLAAWLEWLRSEKHPAHPIGLMGESLGAAIALQYAPRDPDLAFVIADCCFSDLTELFTYHMAKDFHLPAFPLLPLAAFWCWLFSGMTFSKASPLEYVNEIKVPVLFTHGQADAYTPPHMSEALYASKTQGLRRLYFAPGADHAEAFWKDPVAYDRVVGEFLSEI